MRSAIVDSIVGWVEVTKPFDYAVTERSRSAGQRPTSRENLCWVSRSPLIPILYEDATNTFEQD